jgi:hypothetical protein
MNERSIRVFCAVFFIGVVSAAAHAPEGTVYKVYQFTDDRVPEMDGDALHVFKLLGHRHGEAQSLGNIGLLHRCRGAEVEALDYLAQARAIYRDMGGSGGQAVERALAEMAE